MTSWLRTCGTVTLRLLLCCSVVAVCAGASGAGEWRLIRANYIRSPQLARRSHLCHCATSAPAPPISSARRGSSVRGHIKGPIPCLFGRLETFIYIFKQINTAAVSRLPPRVSAPIRCNKKLNASPIQETAGGAAELIGSEKLVSEQLDLQPVSLSYIPTM